MSCARPWNGRVPVSPSSDSGLFHSPHWMFSFTVSKSVVRGLTTEGFKAALFNILMFTMCQMTSCQGKGVARGGTTTEIITCPTMQFSSMKHFSVLQLMFWFYCPQLSPTLQDYILYISADNVYDEIFNVATFNKQQVSLFHFQLLWFG